jgi:quinohemoprotein amine dehydrogenase
MPHTGGVTRTVVAFKMRGTNHRSMNRQIAKALFLLLLASLFCLVLFAQGGGQSPTQQAVGRNVEEGIPISDPLVISKCSGCHQKDEKGNLSRIS